MADKDCLDITSLFPKYFNIRRGVIFAMLVGGGGWYLDHPLKRKDLPQFHVSICCIHGSHSWNHAHGLLAH